MARLLTLEDAARGSVCQTFITWGRGVAIEHERERIRSIDSKWT